jgi:hypothetical protein
MQPLSNQTVNGKPGFGDWLRSLLFRLFPWLFPKPPNALPYDSDPFVNGLLEQCAQQIASALAMDKQAVDETLMKCRAGQPDPSAQRLHLRVDCGLRKISAVRVAVDLSICLLKADKPVLIQIKHEASWDELPGEIRAEFIRNNPPEVHYVICEQPATTENAKGNPV